MSQQSELKQKHDEALALRRDKEADARPDAFHRAVIFILKAIRENNPDFTEEVNHHIATLDSELAVPAALKEIEKPAAAAAATPATPKPPNVAETMKTSRRFTRK